MYGLFEGASRRDVIHFDDLSLQNELLIEAVLGQVEICSIAVKWSNSGKFQFFFEFPFFVFAHLVIQYLGKMSAFGHFSAVGYDDAPEK